MYHSLLVPDDHLFSRLDKVCRLFVISFKGMEKVCNITHTISPKNSGGMGIHQIFSAFRAQYITVMQDILLYPSPIREMS